MPEGDTIRTVADALIPVLEGRTLRSVELREGYADVLANATVLRVAAHGKHLFIHCSGGWLVRSHLGMYGEWHRYAPGEPWRRPALEARLVLRTDADVLICYNAREVEVIEDGGFRHRDLRHRLGPDLMAPAFELDEVLRRARALVRPEQPVVDLLLNQGVAAGIGNVYTSEVLFVERVHPETPVGRLGVSQIETLYLTAHRLLRSNVACVPRRTRPGNGRGDQMWVYGRAGLPCAVCESRVREKRLGRNLRPTFWCPRCQQVLGRSKKLLA